MEYKIHGCGVADIGSGRSVPADAPWAFEGPDLPSPVVDDLICGTHSFFFESSRLYISQIIASSFTRA